MEGVRPQSFLLAALLLGVIVAPGAMAVTSVPLPSGIHETLVIPVDSFHAYRVFLSDVDTLHVDIRATTGLLMDVYVLDSTNFLAYVRGFPAFVWIEGPSVQNAAAAVADFRPPQDGNYYVVVDNRFTTPYGAVPVGPLKVAVALGPFLATVDPSWAAVVVLIGIGVAFVAALAVSLARPGWHDRPWVRRTWTGPRPTARGSPESPVEYNEFADAPPRA